MFKRLREFLFPQKPWTVLEGVQYLLAKHGVATRNLKDGAEKAKRILNLFGVVAQPAEKVIHFHYRLPVFSPAVFGRVKKSMRGTAIQFQFALNARVAHLFAEFFSRFDRYQAIFGSQKNDCGWRLSANIVQRRNFQIAILDPFMPPSIWPIVVNRIEQNQCIGTFAD